MMLPHKLSVNVNAASPQALEPPVVIATPAYRFVAAGNSKCLFKAQPQTFFEVQNRAIPLRSNPSLDAFGYFWIG
jgi:hypothetical protein